MKPFLDSTPAPGLQTADSDGDVRMRATKSYLQVEYKLESDVYVTVYYLPRSESSVFVAACWEHAFDDLLESLGGDEDAVETMVETWPSLGELLANGMKDRYSNGALIVLEDPDCGERKWFVASVSGNLDLDDDEGLFTEGTQEVTQLVIRRSFELLSELQENQPSLLRAIGKGLLMGVTVSVLAAFGIPIGGD